MEKGKFISAAKPAESFYQKETFCESLFREGGPYWHLCTPGTYQEIIFSTKEEMIAAMNLLAITAVEYNQKIYAECLMNNHIHIIVSCDENTGYQFFRAFKQRLKRYLASINRNINLSNFEVKSLLPIDSLETLRNEIVYVNRNGYVANRNHNPFSYIWGTGCLYFNDSCRLWFGEPFEELRYEEQRRMIHGRYRKFNTKLFVDSDMILPSSYCSVREGEKLFRDNWHYFSMLTKDYDAYGLVAKRLSDSTFLTDEEIFPAVKRACLTRYNIKQPRNLLENQKREMIVYMHNELSSTNDQIRRILNIDIRIVNELFPLSAR